MHHELYMSRCLELAEKGLGTTYPNPLVGSVIVHENKIIGEGWHQRAGGPHAEVRAINSVEDRHLLAASTLYVNLEPCSHFGKTPPCADLILEHKIPRVVVGCLDPNAKVSGRGIRRLRDHGVEVIEGVLMQECQALNRRFFSIHQKRRPYVILKWAQSEDAYLFPDVKQGETQGPVWISNLHSRQLVHQWRTEEASILVGRKTVEQDDPSLTPRDFVGENLLRLVLDPNKNLSSEYKLFKDQNETVVLVDRAKVEKETSVLGHHEMGANHEVGVNHEVDLNFDGQPLNELMDYLFKAQVHSLIVEGGATTLNSFIEAGLWDEARVFHGKVAFHGGVKAPDLRQDPIKVESIGSDRLYWYQKEP